MKICFYCNKNIVDRYTMIGMDSPFYFNAFFDKECVEIIRSENPDSDIDFLGKYLMQHLDKIEELIKDDAFNIDKKKSKILTRNKK